MPARQPLLHDLVCCVRAPTVALSGRDGQLRPDGAQGVVHGDIRVLSRAELTVGGVEPEPVAGGTDAGATARFSAVARSLGDPGADPTVRIDRIRAVRPGLVTEEIWLTSGALTPVDTEVVLTVAADLAPIEEIKSGASRPAVPVRVDPVTGAVRWRSGAVAVELTGTDATVEPVAGGQAARLRWPVRLAGPGRRALCWRLGVADPAAVVAGVTGEPPWSRPAVVADDHRLAALLARALDDLAGLRLVTPDAPGDVFLGAGAPWFLTLFGRDSLWAARMLLPLGTSLAGGTLRALAARQGRAVDPATGEEPGKIPHELRRAPSVHPMGRDAPHDPVMRLPPLYYGTVDATPLWVCLLHDAWRWGMPETEVAALLPHAEAALAWMADHGDADGDGLLEYVDRSGRGLANQGWKDSGDSIRFADGSRATAPVALCEVQGYAHQAALAGARLLEAFDRPGADRWGQWAADLAGVFRERFWVADADGPFPALALDGAKRPVDSLTSNIGHLLGTGLLDDAETELVARRVVGPDLDTGYGLRTMSARAAAYWPLSYHCGSVWPHDTAIVLLGLVRTGHAERAGSLAAGLLRSGAAFGYRLPELFAGDSREQAPRPVPYPAACRPQAWSAASAVVVLTALLGLTADVPDGRVGLSPIRPGPVGALRVDGLRVGEELLRVSVDRDGRVTEAAAGPLTVEWSRPVSEAEPVSRLTADRPG
ncbi:MAG TPA: glycogen debranching N-terminal domain-containing protein [Mycobacteriales bacterium]|nr:glycogen debranching N-terminal domain-containing protein [Mycobacteriales bacterium]